MVLYVKKRCGSIFELIKIYPDHYKVHPLREHGSDPIDNEAMFLIDSKDVVKINSNLQELK